MLIARVKFICCLDVGNSGDRLVNINSFSVHKCTVPGCVKVTDTHVLVTSVLFVNTCDFVKDHSSFKLATSL